MFYFPTEIDVLKTHQRDDVVGDDAAKQSLHCVFLVNKQEQNTLFSGFFNFIRTFVFMKMVKVFPTESIRLYLWCWGGVSF